MVPLGIRRLLYVPCFGALSNVGVSIGAVFESGSGFRCSGDVCPFRTVDARSSTSWSAGLGFRMNRPCCGSNVLGTVPGHERRPTEGKGESTVCWGVCGPTPDSEGFGIVAGGCPTNVDLSGRHGCPLGSDVAAAILSIE